jgi:hypothetical protein
MDILIRLTNDTRICSVQNTTATILVTNLLQSKSKPIKNNPSKIRNNAGDAI